MIPAALLLAVQAPAVAPPAPTPDCRYDRAAMLALDERAFDQDLRGGWRRVQAAGCEGQAAGLIRDWLAAHPATDPSWRGVMRWHEGQMRAIAGDTAGAVAAMEASRRVDDEIGWNHYLDGTVAFLRHDRTGFGAARARPAALPRPAGFDPRGPDGRPRALDWPVNLGVLDAPAACRDRPYCEAYACGGPGR